jgi:hypothetical protein
MTSASLLIVLAAGNKPFAFVHLSGPVLAECGAQHAPLQSDSRADAERRSSGPVGALSTYPADAGLRFRLIASARLARESDRSSHPRTGDQILLIGRVRPQAQTEWEVTRPKVSA